MTIRSPKCMDCGGQGTVKYRQFGVSRCSACGASHRILPSILVSWLLLRFVFAAVAFRAAGVKGAWLVLGIFGVSTLLDTIFEQVLPLFPAAFRPTDSSLNIEKVQLAAGSIWKRRIMGILVLCLFLVLVANRNSALMPVLALLFLFVLMDGETILAFCSPT